MLDKADAPLIPEGYAISVAFASLLDVVKGVTTIVTQEMQGEERRLRNQARDRELHVVNSETKEKESTEEKEEDANSFLLQVDEGIANAFVSYIRTPWKFLNKNKVVNDRTNKQFKHSFDRCQSENGYGVLKGIAYNTKNPIKP